MSLLIKSSRSTSGLVPVLGASKASSFSYRSLLTSATAFSPVKPGGNSEATLPEGGSTEEVAHSSGAYTQESNPHESGAQIQQEKGDKVDMKNSAATSDASEAATEGGQAGTGSKSKRDDPVSKDLPPASGRSD